MYLGDVPASNIFNLETNLQDDPGRYEAFVRTGRKQVDIVKDRQWSFTNSKIFISNGQKEVIGATVPCQDDSTNTFDQWFMNLLLEHVQKNPRRYVLYSINVDVARCC